MLDILKARFKQKNRTIDFPATTPALPDRLRGMPVLDQTKCETSCETCVKACPAGAISVKPQLTIDLGRCIFCTDCSAACPHKAMHFTNDHKLAAESRSDLVRGSGEYKLASAINDKSKKIFGHSLKLRQVSAGGCNACEADVNVLNTVVFDLGRFGIQFVASPRHADGLLITGPVTTNMKLALQKTYEALPEPRLVIAVGACAISGGLFRDHPETCNGVEPLLPVDLFIPGCPPHPLTILDGILRLLGKLP